MVSTRNARRLPGEDLRVDRMPGHWLLAKLGKRVLRPGGLGLTKSLLSEIDISQEDTVVEFAPGLGVTARLILERSPRSYVGAERDQAAADWTRKQLPASAKIVVGAAEHTGLPDHSASVVIDEAMLTMNPDAHKRAIADEAFRLLRPGGRYGIHELAITPDNLAPEIRAEIESALSSSIHVGARPLTLAEWQALLSDAGFQVDQPQLVPMRLLTPAQLLADEGLLGAAKFFKNVALNSAARKRVFAMRRVFRKYQDHLHGIAIVAHKPERTD